MVAYAVPTMPKRSTKPSKGDGPKKPSSQIRVKNDLGLMIAWITRIKGGSSPELVDRYLRHPVQAMYDGVRAKAEEMKADDKDGSLPDLPNVSDAG